MGVRSIGGSCYLFADVTRGSRGSVGVAVFRFLAGGC